MAHEVRHIDPDKLLDANRDYLARVERDGLYAVYDSALDILVVEFGGPKEALSEHVLDNIMIRIDPDTLEIVGVEILDFFSDFLPNNRMFREAIGGLELYEGQDSKLTLMEPRFKLYRDVIEAMIPQMVHSIASA